MRKNFTLLFALILMGSSSGVFAQVTPSKADLKKAITSGDHKTLAQYYREKAAAERNEAAMHEEMAKTYKDNGIHYKGSADVMPTHCEALKDHALKLAEKYDAMAAAEEKLASEAPAK